ncbi:hypothetical protein Slala04_66170 [Streptomyces lavendulae subsp. lavendulae]|nr:hypothetical protein Slala04_66170 [Streptomyces lavendulae subsp. lavendulae]
MRPAAHRRGRLDKSWVSGVLAAFGIGALIGTTIGGRAAHAHLFGVLLTGNAASRLLLIGLALCRARTVDVGRRVTPVQALTAAAAATARRDAVFCSRTGGKGNVRAQGRHAGGIRGGASGAARGGEGADPAR